MKIIEDICYGDKRPENQTLDLYLPESDIFSVFIYFHGGGLNSGDKKSAALTAEYLAQKNIAVVSANYTLYPTAVYPVFIEDAALAVSWTFKNIGKYGRCEKFYIGGSSAGAYISMMLCFDTKYLASYGINPSDISGYVHNAGQPTSHFNVLKERGFDSKRIIVDDTAPLYHVGTSEFYGPMLFIVSDNDLPGRYEQTMLMLSALKNFNCDSAKTELRLMHGGHCHYCRQLDEKGESVFGKMIYEFIEKCSTS